MSHREWLRADFARQGLKQQWRALFRDFDVVICPPAATQAFPHDHSTPQEARKLDCRRKGISLSAPTGLGRTRNELRPAGDGHSPRALPTVCRAASRSSALNSRTGRRSPSPARSSASSAASRPRPATHRGVRAVRHTRRRRAGLSASDRRGRENRERCNGVSETLALRSHSGPRSGQLPTPSAHSDCG